MKQVLLFALLSLIAGCARMSPATARDVACSRLAALQDGPSLKGAALCSALQVQEHQDGKFLVELRDESQKMLWAVTVGQTGQAEVSRMAIGG